MADISVPGRPATGALTLTLVFGGLYAVQGVTGSLVQIGLPAILRQEGVALDRIGLLYLLFLPWGLKFLWAPAVDRYWLPRLGRRRSWLLPCQAGLLLALAATALTDPIGQLPLLMALLFVMALLAATQDTATDALAVEVLPGTGRGLAGSAQVAGGYLGIVVGVGAWLPLYAAFGWAVSVALLALAAAILTIPTWLARDIERGALTSRARPSLRNAWARPQVRRGLAAVLAYQLGSRLGVALLGPFLIDAAMPLATIGWVKGMGGAVTGLVSAVLAGVVLRHMRPGTGLWLFAGLHALVFVGLACAAGLGWRDPLVVGFLALAQGAAFACCFVALYSTMMGWCSSDQPGTDFALLQSADAVLAIVAGLAAGAIGQALGHLANFTIAAAALTCAAAGAWYFTTRRLL
ncbi:MAG: MFS transporter [Ferrovibrionaceae bacterium]